MNQGTKTLLRAIRVLLFFCFMAGISLARTAGAQSEYYDVWTIVSWDEFSLGPGFYSITRVNSHGMLAYTVRTQIGFNPNTGIHQYNYQSYLVDTVHRNNLPVLLPGNYIVVQMNDNGWIAGIAPDPGYSGGQGAYVYVPSATNGLAAGWNQIPNMGCIAGYAITETGVQDINNRNQIVGLVGAPQFGLKTSIPSAAIWTPGSTPALQVFGAAYTYASAINDQGTVVGQYTYNPTNNIGYMFTWSASGSAWSPTGGITYPPAAPAFTLSYGDDLWGSSINSKGEIAGTYSPGVNHNIAASSLWLPNPAYGLSAGAHSLPTNKIGGTSEAFGINDYGNVVTYDYYSALAQIWSNGKVYNLNALPEPLFAGFSHPYSISNQGQIIVSAGYTICLLTPKFQLSTLTFDKSAASPGDTVTATISLNIAAPFDLLVNVANSNPSTLSTVRGVAGPSTFQVTIPAGSTGVSIPMYALSPALTSSATLSAEYYQVHVSASSTVVAPPSLSSLSPNTVVAGGGAKSITVTGANFVAGSQVMVNGVAVTTTFGSSTSLTAAVPAGMLTTAGTPPVTVVNPSPNGGTSNAQPLSIVGNPQIALTSAYYVGRSNVDGKVDVTFYVTNTGTATAVNVNVVSLKLLGPGGATVTWPGVYTMGDILAGQSVENGYDFPATVTSGSHVLQVIGNYINSAGATVTFSLSKSVTVP